MGQEVIGVCGSASLAQHLSTLGLTVIGAPDFRQAVALLRNAQSERGAFPIIVVDAEPVPSIRPWVESQSRRTDVRIIPGDGGVLSGHGLAVDLPISLGDLLAGLGLPAPLSDESELMVHHGGTVAGVSGSLTSSTSEPVPLAQPVEQVLAAPPVPQQTIPIQQPVQAREPEPTSSQAPTVQPVQMPQVAPPQTAAPQPLTPTLDGASSGRNVPATPSPGAVEGGADESGPDWLMGLLAGQDTEPEPPPATRQQPSQPLFRPQPQQPAAPGIDQFAQPQQPAFVPQPSQPLFHQHSQPSQAHPGLQQWPGSGSVNDYFDSKNPMMQMHAAAQAAGNCIIIGARKGGVGKTSFSLMIAQSASQAGLRTVLVDMNRGQANSRKYLKLEGQPLPTIHDSKNRGWQASISLADQMSQARGTRGPVSFDLVQGPPEHLASPEDTPAALYESVISELRRHYDLVVVDTQIAEAHFTDLWDEVVVPELRSGAWFLGLFDKSSSAMPDLQFLAQKFVSHYGLTPARTLIAANRWVDDFDDEDTRFIEQAFNGIGQFVGSCQTDNTFSDQILGGFIPIESPAVAPVIRETLYRVTGLQEFAPVVYTKRELRRARRKERRRR